MAEFCWLYIVSLRGGRDGGLVHGRRVEYCMARVANPTVGSELDVGLVKSTYA